MAILSQPIVLDGGTITVGGSAPTRRETTFTLLGQVDSPSQASQSTFFVTGNVVSSITLNSTVLAFTDRSERLRSFRLVDQFNDPSNSRTSLTIRNDNPDDNEGDAIGNFNDGNGLVAGANVYIVTTTGTDFRPVIGGTEVRAIDLTEFNYEPRNNGGDILVDNVDGSIVASDCTLFGGFLQTETSGTGRINGTTEGTSLGVTPRTLMDLDNVHWKIVRSEDERGLVTGPAGYGGYNFSNVTMEIPDQPGVVSRTWPGFGGQSRYRLIADGLRIVNLDQDGSFEFHLRASTNDSTLSGFQPVGIIGVQIKASQALFGSDWRDSLGSIDTGSTSFGGSNASAVMRVTGGTGGATNELGAPQVNVNILNGTSGSADYESFWSVSTNDNLSAQINNGANPGQTAVGSGVDLNRGIILYLLNPIMPNTSLWMMSGTGGPTSTTQRSESRLAIAYRPSFVLGNGSIVNDFYIRTSGNISEVRSMPTGSYDGSIFPPSLGNSFTISELSDYGNGYIIEVDTAVLTSADPRINESLNGSLASGNSLLVKSYLYDSPYDIAIPSSGTDLIGSVDFGGNTTDITVSEDPLTLGTTRDLANTNTLGNLLSLYQAVKADWTLDGSQAYEFSSLVTSTESNVLTFGGRDLTFEVGARGISVDPSEITISNPIGSPITTDDTFNAISNSNRIITWYPNRTISIGIVSTGVIFYGNEGGTLNGTTLPPDGVLIDSGDPTNLIPVSGNLLLSDDRGYTIRNANIEGLSIARIGFNEVGLTLENTIGDPFLGPGVVTQNDLRVNIINNDSDNNLFSLYRVETSGSLTLIEERSNVGDDVIFQSGSIPELVGGLDYRIVWSGRNRRADPLSGSLNAGENNVNLILSDVSYPSGQDIDISAVSSFTSVFTSPSTSAFGGTGGELAISLQYNIGQILESGVASNRWLRENIVGTTAYNETIGTANRDLIRSEGSTGPAGADGEWITLFPIDIVSLNVGHIVNTADVSTNPTYILGGEFDVPLQGGGNATIRANILPLTNFNLSATSGALGAVVRGISEDQVLQIGEELDAQLRLGVITNIGRPPET